MRIIFWGSDDFAARNLEHLLSLGHEVVACVAPPDKPKGRHLHLCAPLTKEVALRHRREVLQPDDLRDKKFLQRLKDHHSDLFVVIAYGRLLTDEILAIPNIFSVNVHAALLPRYRGAAPINWAIINGEAETGISVIQVAKKLDSGDILSQSRVLIADEDTAITLKEKIIQESLCLLPETLQAIDRKTFTLTPQDPKAVTLAPKLTKENGLIDWRKDARKIRDLVRGLLPWPTAYTYHDGKMLKILDADVMDKPSGCAPGEVMAVSSEGICVATSRQALVAKIVHAESSRPMDAASFAFGHKIKPGSVFSSKNS